MEINVRENDLDEDEQKVLNTIRKKLGDIFNGDKNKLQVAEEIRDLSESLEEFANDFETEFFSDKSMNDVFIGCLDELYRNAEPPISFDEVVEKYGGTDEEFYQKHVIEKKVYDEIVEDYGEKVPEHYEDAFQFVLLDAAPAFKKD